MPGRFTRFLDGCRSIAQRRKELTNRLIKNPFWPILFIGESVKIAVIAFANTGVFITPAVIAMAVAAVVVTVIWLAAEVIMKNIDDVTDELSE